MLKVAYSPVYVYDLPEGHRFPMRKYALLAEQLEYEGTVEARQFFEPDPFDNSDLLYTHTRDYVTRLESLPLSRKEERKIGFPVKTPLINRGRHIAKGSLLCALYAMEYGIAMNIAGGTHHAFADHGEGFCVFNDFALTAHHLMNDHGLDRILIVDLDVHQGNGTASIFAEEPEVFTFSMHGARNYPLKKVKSDMDIPLEDACTDATYLDLLAQHLPGIVDSYQPQMMLYLAGVDVLVSDRLGRLSLTRTGCMRRDRFVFELCRKNNIPVAVSMGGGYSPKISDIVEGHANTFRVAQEVYF